MTKFIDLLQRHIDLMDRVVVASQLIFEAASEMEIDQVVLEMENRERLIKLVSYFQEQVEQFLKSDKFDSSQTHVEITKCWFNDLSKWAVKVSDLDDLTSHLLEAQKKKVSEEMISVNGNRKKMGGYNLTNLKNR